MTTTTYGLKTWPDRVLNRHCKKIDDVVGDAELPNLIAMMIKIVEDKSGLGLAGNQIGYLGRVIVAKLKSADSAIIPLVNPIITIREGMQRTTEGCLSVPGVHLPVNRAEWIAVTYQKPDGETVTGEFEGRDAVVIQHEIDHLDGRTLADHPGVKKWNNNGEKLKSLKADYQRKAGH